MNGVTMKIELEFRNASLSLIPGTVYLRECRGNARNMGRFFLNCY